MTMWGIGRNCDHIEGGRNCDHIWEGGGTGIYCDHVGIGRNCDYIGRQDVIVTTFVMGDGEGQGVIVTTWGDKKNCDHVVVAGSYCDHVECKLMTEATLTYLFPNTFASSHFSTQIQS